MFKLWKQINQLDKDKFIYLGTSALMQDPLVGTTELHLRTLILMLDKRYKKH